MRSGYLRIVLAFIFCICLACFLWWQRSTISLVAVPVAEPVAGPVDLPGMVDESEADVRILMLGNSHTSMYELPRMLAGILEELSPGRSYYVQRSKNMEFLQEKWDDAGVQEMFQRTEWDFVVLQAQKYSVSGRYAYPTDGTEKWIRACGDRNISPVLYPEWGQRGNLEEEGRRVDALYRQIAESAGGGTVAPINLAWELCSSRLPERNLYVSDGNHASFHGAYLTACVLAATVSKQSPVGLDHPNQIDASEGQVIQECAWQAYQESLAEDNEP